jgi:deoxyribonuclease-4
MQKKTRKTHNYTHNKTYINKTKKQSYKTILGCHVSISHSILDGIKYLDSIHGNAAQIFLGSNRSASMKTKTKLTADEITDIREYIHSHKITLIVHSIYLLNFCMAPPTSGRVKYMHENLQYDLHIGAQIGAICVVLHLGFKTHNEPAIAMQNLIGNLNKILNEMPDNISLALETSAGQGTQIGYTLEELATIWNGVKHNNSNSRKQKVGICIDTAHIFVSGVDISSPTGVKHYLEDFNNNIGWKNIILFHINDSRFPVGSKKDEHRGIGSGLIYNKPSGKKALKYIKTFCEKLRIPMILETHSAGSPISEGSHAGAHGYEWEIDYIRKL